jgi:hypothetical protein
MTGFRGHLTPDQHFFQVRWIRNMLLSTKGLRPVLAIMARAGFRGVMFVRRLFSPMIY